MEDGPTAATPSLVIGEHARLGGETGGHPDREYDLQMQNSSEGQYGRGSVHDTAGASIKAAVASGGVTLSHFTELFFFLCPPVAKPPATPREI